MRLWTIRIANAARISTKIAERTWGFLFPNYSPSRDCFTYTPMRLSGPGVLIFASRVYPLINVQPCGPVVYGQNSTRKQHVVVV